MLFRSSLFLGIAIAVLPNDLPAKDGLQKFFDYGNTAITKVVEIVMGFAPIESAPEEVRGLAKW